MSHLRLPIVVDVQRSNLQWRFFARYGAGEKPGDVIAAAMADPLDTASVIAGEDCVRRGYAGWSYWLLYLRGYHEYRERGALARGNDYVRYFIEHYLPGPHDPGLRAHVPDEASAVARVGARFTDFRRLLEPRSSAGAAAAIRDVRILASHRPGDDLHDVHDAASGAVVKARAIDGWHRLFAARLGGVSELPGEVRLDDVTWTHTP